MVRLVVKKEAAAYCYQSVRNSQTDIPVLTCAAARLADGSYRFAVGARPLRAVLYQLPAAPAAELADQVQQQVVTGTAMNILAVGICSYFQRVLFGVPTTPLQIDTLPKLSIPLLSKIPFIGEIFFQQNILTYMAYILIPVSIFVLYKTSLGLAIRSTGENPVAVDVAGLPVNRIRFLTVLVAGCIGGLAGSFYTVGYLGMFSSNIIGGRGWIAFAICFLGNWSPKGAVLGTLAFGLADALSIYFRTGTTAVPTELIIALPYILTIVLTIFRSNFRVPAKLGVPYRKEG